MTGKTAATILRALRARAEQPPFAAQTGKHEVVALQIARTATGDGSFDKLVAFAVMGMIQFQSSEAFELLRTGYKLLETDPSKEWHVTAKADKMVAEQSEPKIKAANLSDTSWIQNALGYVPDVTAEEPDENKSEGGATPEAE